MKLVMRLLKINSVIFIILSLLYVMKLSTAELHDTGIIKANTNALNTPIKYRRPLNSTLLTFPEWYLVYSPQEYADFTKSHFPSEFPFFREAWQYWDSYYLANALSNKFSATNMGDQVMLIVIGVSTTIEYVYRGLYEQTVGALTAKISGRVEEDEYGATVAKQYVDFIESAPWFEFNFFHALKNLWLENHFFGPGFIRKLERKYSLTTEYLVKGIYGKLIALASHSFYGVESTKTVVKASYLSPNIIESNKDIKIIKKNSNGTQLLELPRLDAFAKSASWLAINNVQFYEIAGNNSFIAISILVPTMWNSANPNIATVFRQEIYTMPGMSRLMLVAPIAKFGDALNFLNREKVHIEHVYDY